MMKRLLAICLLCLASIVLRGASVPFTAFRGSNAVTIITNPTDGIVIISAPVATGTNALAQTNGANMGSFGTVNFGNGITGVQSGVITRIGVDPSLIGPAVSSNSLTRIQLNGTNVSTMATSLNLVIGNGVTLSGTNNPSGSVSVGIDVPTSTNQALTNITVTVDCYTTANADTNRIVLSGFGLGAVNGTYVFGPTISGVGAFTNVLGTYKIAFSPGYGSYVVSNATAELYGSFANPPFSTWDDDLGGGLPLGIGAFDSVTNCFTNIVASSGYAFSLPKVSTNVWLSASTGNDTNAIAGRIDRPARTLAKAITLLPVSGGGTIYAFPGNYALSSATLSNHVNLVGMSRDTTIFGTDNDTEETLYLLNGSSIENLTVYAAVYLGQSGGLGSTNALISNCDIHGIGDAVYGQEWDKARIENSWLTSAYDVIADWDVRPGGSNRVMKIINCRLEATNISGGSTIIQGITGGDNRIEMFGGSIEVKADKGSGGTRVYCVSMDVDVGQRTNKTGSMVLSNVRLRHFNNAGTGGFVTNFNRLPIFLDNCTFERTLPGTMGALVNNNFTNGWEHRYIVFTNNVEATNWLVDTRSLTNAAAAASEQAHRVTICDGGFNAATSNLWIATQGNQKVLATGLAAGPTITNIDRNGGCLTFRLVGTNWMPESVWP